MSTYGFARSSASSPDSGITGTTTLNQIFSVFPDVSGHQWAYQWAAHIGKNGTGNVTVQGGIQSISGGNPDVIHVLTNSFTVTTPMSDGTNGAISTRDLQQSFRLFDGHQYAVGFAAITNPLTFGMRAAGNASQPDDANNLFYYRNKTTLPPTDGYSSTSFEGWLAVWLITQANHDPDIPATVTVAGLSSTNSASPSQIGTFTPSIVGSFSDADETLPNGLAGDSLKRYQIQVLNNATGAVVWDSNQVTASSGEQSARQFTKTYGGPALAAATTYKVRTRVYDQFDAASGWSAYRYFTISAGSMDTPTGVSGKQLTQSPTPFTATWRHTGGLSTNAVRVHIHDADTDVLLRDSGYISRTVAPNASTSVTWAQTGFAPLDWGTNAYWHMFGRDTGNVAGSVTDPKAFTVDAAPSIPANNLPANNAVVTSRPLLAATVTDADDAQTALTVKFRIKDSGGTVLFTRTGTRNATTGRFEYQTTSTDLAAFGTFTWDAYAFDGTVYSGGTTVEASAGNSADWTFVYASGPTVAITSPTDGSTLTTATPTITYTAPTQVSRRIQVIRGGIVIHDISQTNTFHTYALPSALSSGEHLADLDVVTLSVTVTDGASLSATDQVTVTIDFPTPETLTLSADLAMAEGDITPSYVLLSWPQSSYPLVDAGIGAFYKYILTRKVTADALAADPTLPSETVTLKQIKSVTETSFEDHTARAGVEYEWGLRQYVLANSVSLLPSLTDHQTLTVMFEATIIHDARDPKGTRIVLAAREDRTITPIDDVAVLMPWNQQKPIHLHGETYYNEIDCTYSVVAETPQAATAIMRRAQAMARTGGPLHYRDGRGNSFWGEFAAPPVETDTAGGAPRKLHVVFRELAYDESVTDSEEQ